MARRSVEVEIGGRTLSLSNLDKVLYPAASFTKAQVIDYYIRIAPALLPHLKDRPLTLKRYPDGVQGPFFYEKSCPSHRPAWVKVAPIHSRHRGATINFCLANDLPTLVWAANLADLELHTSLSRWQKIERPTMLVFDLDPGRPAGLLLCCEVGILLKQVLDRLGLESFPKTSGAKGLQIYVPLNVPVTYGHTKPFAQALAELLERRHPDKVVSKMNKRLRSGKVLVDWSQNDEHKTTVNVYSLRARQLPTVSTPVSWQEVTEALRAREPNRLVFEADALLRRVERTGDLFAKTLELRQQLPQSVSEQLRPTR
jgi:bifunctional non-homologous end joining protein LigD